MNYLWQYNKVRMQHDPFQLLKRSVLRVVQNSTQGFDFYFNSCLSYHAGKWFLPFENCHKPINTVFNPNGCMSFINILLEITLG